MSPPKPSHLDPDLEQRLRDEARSGGEEPGPYLHTRIMAEVSALHAEKMGRPRRRWLGVLGGGLVTVLVLWVVVSHWGQPSGSPPSPIAGVHPVPLATTSVGEGAVAFTQELQTTVYDPFGSEIESLGADVKRAAIFLGECLPL